MGNLFIGVGGILIIIGLLLKTNLLNWFGKLPGDIRYEGDNFVLFAPFTSMILISIVISLLFWIFNR